MDNRAAGPIGSIYYKIEEKNIHKKVVGKM
jgi:hypothetical protein